MATSIHVVFVVARIFKTVLSLPRNNDMPFKEHGRQYDIVIFGATGEADILPLDLRPYYHIRIYGCVDG